MRLQIRILWMQIRWGTATPLHASGYTPANNSAHHQGSSSDRAVVSICDRIWSSLQGFNVIFWLPDELKSSLSMRDGRNLPDVLNVCKVLLHPASESFMALHTVEFHLRGKETCHTHRAGWRSLLPELKSSRYQMWSPVKLLPSPYCLHTRRCEWNLGF